MNFDFTDRLRLVLAKAREQALRHRHDYLGPEHLLLALLDSGDAEVLRILEDSGIRTEDVTDAVLGQVRPGTSELHLSDLPYTSGAKRVLEQAMGAARQRRAAGRGRGGAGRRRSCPVGPVDLLAGLVGEERGIAGVVLREAGLTPDALGLPTAAGRGARAELEVIIDDASDRSIYEQIVEQIQEHVAVGRLEPGERLPTVRRLADSLDIAPGTVARAYGELERLGLVVTRGARGTRVAERDRSTVPDRQRSRTLAGLLRPVAVAAFHLGGTADELRAALEEAMADIFRSDGDTAA